MSYKEQPPGLGQRPEVRRAQAYTIIVKPGEVFVIKRKRRSVL